MEMPLVISPDYALWEYRRQNELSWADLTGQWPQPRWRTHQDRRYQNLFNMAQRELAEKAEHRA